MQFLWKHVVDLVGKGIGISVLVEFFIYAIATLVPMSLPLAILLASLMSFGNLGENFELTAMKAAGISLFRIMRPLIIAITFVGIGAFFFSNNILPKAQSKLWTLIFSLRQKSPELEIPPGEFYDGIDGYHIYISGKSGSWLKDMMIYDYSAGFNNATVMVADTGKIQFTEDKKYLLLTLYGGESFENLKNQKMSYSSNSIPYRREMFRKKEILIDFNSDFNRYDESVMQNQHVSKNVIQLVQTIDSVGKIVDKRNTEQATQMVSRNYFGRERESEVNLENQTKNKLSKNEDSLFLSLDYLGKEQAVIEAINNAKQKQESIRFNKVMVNDSMLQVRRHQIELHRKFTLSFACLIFFFIGAPLGAIIRKGGLGMPVVISVLMFIVYYIIDNTGYKMAREGLWEVWEGMWLSSAVLLPIGIFLTSKAAADATIFRSERYIEIWNKIKLYFRNLKNRRKKTKTDLQQAVQTKK